MMVIIFGNTVLKDNDHKLEKKYGEIFAPILTISKYSP